MEHSDILSRVDHTLLTQTATWDEIRTVCDEALRYGCASVCLPPSYVKQASAYVAGKIKICTVVGFPNGYSTTAVKCFEARDAIANGAAEIDMVINLGLVRDGLWDELFAELRALRCACEGKLLKVIVETCLLREDEKIKLCALVSASGADYIKTSTGFAGGGATRADIALFARHITLPLKIKASGGISSLQDAEDFLALGASRLGTSRMVKAVKAEGENN